MESNNLFFTGNGMIDDAPLKLEFAKRDKRNVKWQLHINTQKERSIHVTEVTEPSNAISFTICLSSKAKKPATIIGSISQKA